MSEWTLHTGCAGDVEKFHIDWFSHDGVKQETLLEIKIRDQDKPRVLEIFVNQVSIATIHSTL